MNKYSVTVIDYDSPARRLTFSFYVDGDTVNEALRKADRELEDGPPNAEITSIVKVAA